MQLFWLRSGFQNGAYNMALDEALLEWVRACPEPTLIVRTYQWECPTLSLGVNQPAKDLQALFRLYGVSSHTQGAIVRRPTGGRAILHGTDISYALVSNESALLRKSLADSYAILSGYIQDTIEALGISVHQNIDAQNKAYLRSPVCFETHTPSDLLGTDGQKICGSAQLRRSGGILQHGAVFLEPYEMSEERFSAQLFQTVECLTDAKSQPFPMESVQEHLCVLETAYLRESGEILASASVTSGSHLVPASC